MIPTDKLKSLPIETLRALNTAIVAEIKARRYVDSVQKARTLNVGDRVGYRSSKQGGWVVGQIEQINRTRAHVRTIGGDGRTWVVPMNMLQPTA